MNRLAKLGAAFGAAGLGVAVVQIARREVAEAVRLDEFCWKARAAGANPEPWITEASLAAQMNARSTAAYSEVFWRLAEHRYREHVAGQRVDMAAEHYRSATPIGWYRGDAGDAVSLLRDDESGRTPD